MPELIQIQTTLESLVDRSIVERAIPDDPVDEKKNFAEDITSYGDYPINVKIRTRDRAVLASRSLYDALAEAHQGNHDPDVVAALQTIRDH